MAKYSYNYCDNCKNQMEIDEGFSPDMGGLTVKQTKVAKAMASKKHDLICDVCFHTFADLPAKATKKLDKNKMHKDIKSALGITELAFELEEYYDDNTTIFYQRICKINSSIVNLSESDLHYIDPDSVVSYLKTIGKISKDRVNELLKEATGERSKDKTVGLLALLAKVSVKDYIDGLSLLLASATKK